MEDLVYTVQEVSEILKCNKNYVYDLIKKGHLQGLKLGSIKVTKYELTRFLMENTGKDLSDMDNVRELSFG